ncbi:P-loop containing nucleoside triphosphate hydrolases superfamily protein [Actinidia rufa]|uniref:P-loop containing nucleoside triphosphate hydrolases superfamily protein n=1 Tax=Actinidia rufa TaxID=165716 RepID=A0A7J0DBT4_9ERIC|nr:P-loop containing nucleoside triphosphate hydrolases superfamily protein [Actinidia rufa]
MMNEAPPLTIKLGKEVLTSVVSATSDSISPNLRTSSIASSPSNSPSLISPTSSAFVSALQSPYISPRATLLPNPPQENPAPTTLTHPSPPVSYCRSQSNDIPSTSYTPPSEQYDFSDDPINQKLKIVTCVPIPGPDTTPRISFSFLVPRISFAKSSVSPKSDAKLCDVYIGFHGQNPNLVRFCKWLKSELELQGIACFVTDRAKYSDNQSHEEISFFAQKKNLIPLYFDTNPSEIMGLHNRNSDDKECKEAVDGLMRSHEFKLETNEGNWRSCVSKAARILRAKLGRKSVAEKEVEGFEELPFPRNRFFAGRDKEMTGIETAFFGFGDNLEQECRMPTTNRGGARGQSEGRGKRSRCKSFGSRVVCISGADGVGKRNSHWSLLSNMHSDTRWFYGGRIRSFEEQEAEAFKRVKRELFRDMPYLLIIDNLETEKEWWEGKDLHDLIPRITGRGRRRKEYPSEEVQFLGKFVEELGRSSFGLWVTGSLLSELAISPSALFEAINQVPIEETSNTSNLCVAYEQFFRTNPFLMKVLAFCNAILQQTSGKRSHLASRMLPVGAWFAPPPISASLLAAVAKSMPATTNRFSNRNKCLGLALCCFSSCCLASQTSKSEEESALLLVKLGLARRTNRQPGCWIQFHPITQIFARRRDDLLAAKATFQGVRKVGNPLVYSDHLWASSFLVFGFKCEPPIVQLKAVDMVLFIKKTALPLAIKAFTTFSRCNSAIELLKVCTNFLEEVEKSFVSQIKDWCHGSLCWKQRLQSNQRVDEYIWQDVTLLKATLLETRAKLLLRGGLFDNGEELCRTCISIRTVMLGHNHPHTLAAQETLAKLVRLRRYDD